MKLGEIKVLYVRALIFLVLFIFPIPRINNTENNTIQEYSILTKKILKFFILLHFSPFQTILSIFWKSPFLGPKMAHIMGFWAENHLFRVFSFKCLELCNLSRNGIKIMSWILIPSSNFYKACVLLIIQIWAVVCNFIFKLYIIIITIII